MRFSYHWLQTYFNEPLPKPKKLAELLTFHSFEVESVAHEGDDWIFDIDILPNRRHDCLSHRGVAREISVITAIPLARDPFLGEVPRWNTPAELSVAIGDAEGVPRYMAAYMRGVSVGESPDWLKECLHAVGQKSVNNIVDATNYVMFELGQPLHAFDAENFVKEGNEVKIAVRNAKKGERISLLGGEERVLDSGDLVIVDGVSDSPVGIAGIKGGTLCEITQRTKNIIIESANFNPVRIRKTATRLGLRTDALLRFESGLAPEQAGYAMKEVIMLVQKLTGATLIGVDDQGNWIKKESAIPLSVGEVNKLLGTDMNDGVFLDVLEALKLSHKKSGDGVVVTPPFERLDVLTKEDLIEEVGRVYGYEKIAAVQLPKADKSPAVNKNFYYTEKIRDLLVAEGFSEVYTHAIGTQGVVEMENPLADDKKFLRSTLISRQFLAIQLLNEKNKKFLGGDTVKIFEIGKIFGKFGQENERWALLLSSEGRNEVKKARMTLSFLGIPQKEGQGDEGEMYMLDFEKLPEPPEVYTSFKKPNIEPRCRPIPDFPPIFRDIAVFVPEYRESEAVREIIREEAGNLLVGARLFDEFKKDGKISYAFRLVFQSHEKTLTDDEVNEIMIKITNTLNLQEGFIVR